MKRNVLLILLLIGGLSYAKRRSSKNVEKKSVIINVGSSKIIELPFTPSEILKGDKGEMDINPETGEPQGSPSNTIFEAKYKGRRIRIRGLQRGAGNLEVLDKKGRKRMIIWVYISTPQKGRIVKTIKKLLKDVEGIRIYVSGDDVTIDGELFRQQDRERIDRIVEKITKDDGVKIINLTSYSPLFMIALAKKIEKEINDPQVQVKALKDKFMLTGKVTYSVKGSKESEKKDEKEKLKAMAKRDRYHKIAVAYVGEKNYTGGKTEGSGGKDHTIINAIDLVAQKKSQQVDKMIRIQFDFVELAKNYMKKFGFNWAPGIYGENYMDGKERNMLGDMSSVNVKEGGGITSVITGTIRNLFPKLHNAKQFGHAKTLESAQVMTKNKEKAHFKSGTQVVLLKRQEGKPDYYVPTDFGLDATFIPEVMSKNNAVSLEMRISYHSLPSGGIIGPGSNIPHHEVSTTLIIESGKSAAIGGMVKNVSGKMFDKIPQGIENSFVNIYHSKDFMHNRSQMIMFITPMIITDSTSGSAELKRKFRVK